MQIGSAKLFAFALTASSLSSSVGAQPAGPAARETQSYGTVEVPTLAGIVRGSDKDGVSVFLGIPYAAPPIGDLRWKPPQPAKPHAPLDATRFSGNCPQSNEIGVFSGPPSIDEDCLYLNVFTTGTGNAKDKGKPKPVIVWFHGGGNTTGTAADYDGTRLAKGGDGTPAVVVTINYRLGLLGFLAHPAIRQEGPLFANYGTMDQQAALRWVKDNIASFGGDPTRVAIAGQSGGSVDVHAQVVSPLSLGLFNRAIFQSAPAAGFVPLDAATRRASAFAQAAGCPGDTAAAAKCLRALPVARVLQLQGTIKDIGPYLDPANQNIIVDGTIIPMQPAEAYATGAFNKMPVMGGTTHDELTFVIGMQQYYSGPPEGSPVTYSSSPPQHPLTEDEMNERVRLLYGPLTPKLLAEYPLSRYGGSPFEAYNRLLADPVQCMAGLSPLKLFARQVPTYGYVFTYQDAPYYFPHMPGFRARAAHTIDIQFLFDGYHGGPLGVNLDQTTGMPRALNAAENRLADQMIGFWTNFAAYGDPNGEGKPIWPKFDAEKPVFLQQDVPIGRIDETKFRATYRCAFWEGLSPK